MNKLISLFVYLIIFNPINIFSQSESFDGDYDSFGKASNNKNVISKVNQNWELLFNSNLNQFTGGVQYAGVVYVPTFNEIWVSEFGSDYILILNFWGDSLSFYDEIQIEGISNIRGMTFDGRYIYAANNTDSISIIDPIYEDLAGYITAPQTVRYIAFDPLADNNQGGLWIGNFNTDPTLISWGGDIISSIPYSYLGKTTIYGAAYDYYSSGAPFLWFWSQNYGQGTPQVIFQVEPSTGIPTGIEYDVRTDPVIGEDSCLAGGLFITNKMFPDKVVLGGVLQTSPDRIFGYDITTGSPPAATTNSATNISADSATLNGVVNPNDLITSVVFQYGTTTSYGLIAEADQGLISGTNDVNVSTTINGLQPDTLYHFRVGAKGGAFTVYGLDRTFTTSTSTSAPIATTKSATNVTSNSATLNGTVNPNSLSTTVVFEYGTTTSYGTEVSATPGTIDGNVEANVSANISGLESFQTYHYRIKGINSSGTSLGDDVTFNTSVTIYILPSVTTSSATNIDENSAKLNGIVNPNGDTTTVIFEYGTTTSYGDEITAIQSPAAGLEDINVSANLTGLASNTVYHYRIKGSNSSGTSWGVDKTFTTSSPGLSIPIATTYSATNITGNSATLNGIVNSNNLTTTVTFEYGTTASYGAEITAEQSPVTGTADVNVAADLTGLLSNTMYHYRVKASNSNGTATGEDQSFTTGNPPPVASITQASSISANSVTLNGIVNTKNSNTVVKFLYGTSTTYDNQVNAAQSPVPAGLNNVDVSAVITGLLSNTTYHYCIEATNVNGTVLSSDETFKTYISSISLSTTFTFSDPAQQSSYRMIALPGANNLLISQIVPGTQNKDWNAYYDNGKTQDYLEEFDGSSKFRFIPGRGFWILSKDPVHINLSVPPVALSADNTYTIDINYGWNIISNPYEKAIIWQDIANQNGLSSNEIIYDWNGSKYTEPANFEIYKGYYFNNIVESRTALKIPYSFIGKISKDGFSKKTSKGPFVKLSLILNKEEVSYIVAGINPSSINDYDKFDYFAPPGDFADVRIHIENNNLSLPYKQLFIDYRPEIKDGQIYDLKIRNASKKNVNLVYSGVEDFSDSEVYLLDENLNRFYNLKYKNEIYISPVHINYNYKLLIGDTDFINDIKKTYMPDGYILYQNYPNPFNPSTVIKYQIQDYNIFVELKVFNILGKELITLVNEKQDPGIYEVELNSSGLSSGIYFYTLKAGSYSETKKMILIK